MIQSTDEQAITRETYRSKYGKLLKQAVGGSDVALQILKTSWKQELSDLSQKLDTLAAADVRISDGRLAARGALLALYKSAADLKELVEVIDEGLGVKE